MSRIKIDADQIRVQIEALRRDHPEAFEDADIAADTLEGETDLHDVLARIEDKCAEAEAMADAIAARRAEMQERERRCKQTAETMRELMLSLLDAAGVPKVVLPTATISARTTAPKLVVIDEEGIPETYWRVKREIDKTALAEALKTGAEIDGAMLSNGSRSLTIRRT